MIAAQHKVWDEWSRIKNTDAPKDEIGGILGGMQHTERGAELLFTSRRLFVVRRLMRLWNESELGSPQGGGIHIIATQSGKVTFSADRRAAVEIYTIMASTSRRTRNWNWVRGIFGSCGSLNTPKTGYYLAIRPPEGSGAAERVQAILKSCGFTVGVRKKLAIREITLRDQQQIVTFLLRLGLVNAALALEETAIYRSVRNRANKLVNCDAANINKSLETAREQLQLIRRLEALGIAEELPSPLYELVLARKKNPSITLKELGQTLPRPISKSTVEYRWRKLENMIKKHSKGDDANVLGKGRR